MSNPNSDEETTIGKLSDSPVSTELVVSFAAPAGGDLTPVDIEQTLARITEWRSWLQRQERTRALSAGTCEQYRKLIHGWISYLTMVARTDEPTATTVESYRVALLDRGLSLSSTSGYLAAVSSLYRWAELHIPGAVNIASSVRRHLVRRTAPLPAKAYEELRVQVREIPTSTIIGLRDRALMGLLITTGVRLVSIERATIGDVDLEGDGSWRHQAKGRREKSDVATIPSWVLADLHAYVVDRRSTGLSADSPLFTSHDRDGGNKPLSSRSMRSIVVTWFLRWGYLTQEERIVDVINFTDGRSISGTLVSQTEQEVVLVRTGQGRSQRVKTSFPRDQVASIIQTKRWFLTNPRTLSAHSLRRSSVAFVYEQFGAKAGQIHAGHADIRTTEGMYVGVNTDRERKKIAGVM